MKDTFNLLRDLIEFLDQIIDMTRDGREYFETDRKTQMAVERAYEVIGEIAKRLPPSFRNTHDQIDWQRLARFRDFIAYNYERVDVSFMWAAVEDAPRLKSAVEAIVKQIADESDGR
jgi:uncharacterized protein with HEPN domain